jgi:hypothetical protein
MVLALPLPPGVLHAWSERSLARRICVLPVLTLEVAMVARHSAVGVARLVALASAAVLAGCSHNQLETDPGNVPAAVIFANEGLTQSDLFAVISGSSESRKLGTVFAGRTETLRFPYEMTQRGGVSLVARMLNGGVLSTGVVSIRAGDTVHVELPLNHSMLILLP